VRDHIIVPLGLSDTETGFPTDAREPRVATGYSYPGRSQELRKMPRYDANAITPAAGFASTAIDLAKFALWQIALLDGEESAGKVLAANTLREMQRAQWLDWDWSVARGLAFGVYRVGDRTLTGHAGDCPGFNTRIYLDPLDKVAVAVMANRNQVDVDGYAAAIFDILDAGGTVDQKPQTENLNDFIGSYDLSPWSGEVMVFRWEDGLAVISLPTMKPMDSLTVLKHVEGDLFNAVRDNGLAGHDVQFKRDGSGSVTHMRVHSMDIPKL